MTPVVAWFCFAYECHGAYLFGEQYRSGQVVKTSLGTILALIVSSFLVHICELAGGVLCILPGLAFMALFVVTAPAIVIEGLGPWQRCAVAGGSSGLASGLCSGLPCWGALWFT